MTILTQNQLMKRSSLPLTLFFSFAIFHVHILSQEKLGPVHFNTGSEYYPANVDESTTTSDLPGLSDPSIEQYRWVLFESLPDDEVRRHMEAEGYDFTEYIPQRCYLMKIPADFSLKTMYEAGVRSIQLLELRHKVDQRLLLNDVPPHAIRDDGVRLKIQLMKGVDTEAAVHQLNAIAVTDLQLPHHRYIYVTTSMDKVQEMAAIDAIRYIEPTDPPGKPESVEGRTIQKSNLIDNELSGGLRYDAESFRLLVRDDGVVGPHIDFEGRLHNLTTDPTGTHGDGVAGVMGAAGNRDATVVAGASAAEIYVINYEPSFLDNTLTLHQDSGVVITNSSYSNGCNAGYTSATQTVDEQIHDNPTLLHIFSAGNSNNNDCGYGAGTQWGNITGGHKQGKNVVTVANLYRDGTIVASSSRGPAHDGRVKPDLAGHGQGQVSTDPDHQYQSFGGTSAAAPSTGGNLAQLYDVYEDLYGSVPPSSLIKASALNTATDLGNPGPDYIFGWGLIHTGRAYDLIANSQFLSSNISNGQSNQHTISVPAGVGALHIMLYWSDPEASVSADPALVNDLDLVVTDPGSTMHMPLVLNPTPDPMTLDDPAVPGIDHLNNMEQVVVSTPASGNYDISVEGYDVSFGPQEYYIVYAFIPDEIDLTYPIGGERMVQDYTERIQWDAFDNTGSFDLEYTTNNGGSWTTIATGIAADQRGYDWTVPVGVISGECRVRITRDSETDQSTENFSIHGQPSNLTYTPSSLDAVDISWTAASGASEYLIYQLGPTEMELIDSTTSTSTTISGLTNQQYWFSVAAKTGLARGRRILAQPYDHKPFASCDGCILHAPLPEIYGFEDGFGDYCNQSGDDFDWVVHSGATASTGTGPTAAYDGEYYIYVEASDPNFPSKEAVLGSPCIDMEGVSAANLRFAYHMYGASMGSLTVRASDDGGMTFTNLWQVSGDQGDEWHVVQLDLSDFADASLVLNFEAVTGSSYTGDIAIDDIHFIEGELCLLPSNLTTTVTGDHSATMEWDDVSSAMEYELELINVSAGGQFQSTPTHTGITTSHFDFTGLYSSTHYRVRIQTICDVNNTSGWSSDREFSTTGCGDAGLWAESFEAYDPCTTAEGPQSCTIGGGWMQSTADDNDWRVHQGETPSIGTGPIVDHTYGTNSGKYIYIETSGTFDLTSIITSPCIELSNLGDSAVLTFYYHMFGGDMGDLYVDISDDGGMSWTNEFVLSGPQQSMQSDPWEKATVSLLNYTGVIQFRFRGVAGPGFESDIALDDIAVEGSHCAANQVVSGTPMSGTYTALISISSDALILTGRQVIFSSDDVLLDPSFEVELGAEFEANNDDCD